MKLKLCYTCNELKDFNTAFNNFKLSKDGKMTQCKMCVRKKRDEKMDKQPQYFLYFEAKKRAKERNIEFDINLQDLFVPEKCPILDVKLIPNKNGKFAADNSPSIDRKDSSKGYVKGNIQIISFRANNIKGDGTLEEFKLIRDYIKKHQTNPKI